MMRRILVDHARARLSAKRDHQSVPLSLLGDLPGAPPREFDAAELLDLDRALDRLAAAHPRPSRVAELRYFGGLEITEIAAVLDLSDRTVKRAWAFARAWLLRALREPQANAPATPDDPHSR